MLHARLTRLLHTNTVLLQRQRGTLLCNSFRWLQVIKSLVHIHCNSKTLCGSKSKKDIREGKLTSAAPTTICRNTLTAINFL